MVDFDLTGMSPKDLDFWFRQMRTKMTGPFVFGRIMLKAAKHQGLNVDKLIADGILIEQPRIPVTNGSRIYFTSRGR